MNYGTIERPKAPDKKINTSNDFELCLLRHQYFRRANYNPTEAEMQPFMKIVEHFTKNTFFTYFNLFRAVGLYHDDVLNIGRVHLVSFLGLYSLDRTPDKKAIFEQIFTNNNFKLPEEKNYLDKNKANFTLFFKQRMEDLVRVCRQKVRNIKGQPSEEFIVFCGEAKPPRYHRKILREHSELGYRKIDFAVFKSIRKKANVNFDATIFEFAGLWYVAIPLDQKPLALEDIVGSGADPYQNQHNRQPNELLEEKEFETLSTLFQGKTNDKKVKVIRKFIAKNKNSGQYREEIYTARKLLRELGA